MRATNFHLTTLKETPAGAEVISHQLMLRAGLIRRLASGLYTWMPLGLRVLNKVQQIIREEMDASGALEVLMPVVQPSELWQESERWQQYGPELLRIADRHDRAFCRGPTHEEVITDLVRNEISSYRQLPINFYQIQTKFRDEIRPRFGVMRSREFIMKDAYSFHLDQDSLQLTYDRMFEAYNAIFSRIGLDFRPVLADTGSIGGSHSHEFHVLANSGEDDIAFSNESSYAANVEMAEALRPRDEPAPPSEEKVEVSTPNSKSIAEVSAFWGIEPSSLVKTLIVYGSLDHADPDAVATPFALALRGDHELNEIKASKLLGGHLFRFANDDEIRDIASASAGSLGPIGLDIPVIADRSAAVLSDFTCGANRDGFHITGVNWTRDVEYCQIADLRNVVDGDPSPDGKGVLSIRRGIEVGHIFQLGKKYSNALNASVLDENGRDQTLTMGCYGIGVTRVVAAAIEQNNDNNGIIWPEAIAPFTVALVPINMHKSDQVAETAERLYSALSQAGHDVLLMDEPKSRLGATLATVELIGIPHRIVVGDRGLERSTVEYASRQSGESSEVAVGEIVDFMSNLLS